MELERLTIKAQEALRDSQRLAQNLSHQEVDSEHLMLALLQQQDSLIPDLLRKIGVSPSTLQPDLDRELQRRHKVQGAGAGDVFLSNDMRAALEAATAEAGKLKDD